MSGTNPQAPGPRGSSNPRFSILLPTHNRPDVLPIAIRSALWQTDGDFELLVVGDGCTDGTADLTASFEDSRIRWFDLPKAPGIGYANRNVALREARGRYVAYLAHDDIWFPDHLERIGALLDVTGAEFGYSRTLSVRIDGRVILYWHNVGVPQHLHELARGTSSMTMSAVVHARSCLLKYGYWNEQMLQGADKELWWRIIRGGNLRNAVFVAEPTSLHFVANWRQVRPPGMAGRLMAYAAGGLLREVIPPALHLVVPASGTQQQAAWEHLNDNTPERVTRIRLGVVELQDALLWKIRTPRRLVVVRAISALARSWANVKRHLASRDRRRRRDLLRWIPPLEQGVAKDGDRRLDP
jgi:hypothetical protein